MVEILIIEDDHDACENLREVLSDKYNINFLRLSATVHSWRDKKAKNFFPGKFKVFTIANFLLNNAFNR